MTCPQLWMTCWKSLQQSYIHRRYLRDSKSAIRFHIETFGKEVLEIEPQIIEAFVAETGLKGLMAKFPVDAPKRKVVKAFA